MFHSPRSRTRLRVAVTTALAAVALAGCSTTSGGGGAGGAQKPIDKKDIVLVASVINTTNPYMASMIQGTKALSKKLGVPYEIVDSQGSSQVEISKIQAIIAKGKKVALMVNTVSNSDVKPIVNAVKQGGGYVTIYWNSPDNMIPWKEADNFVSYQKYSGVESGRCNADRLGAAMGGKGGVIMMPGVQDSTTSATRVAGFKAELKAKYPGIKILEEIPSNWDPQLATKNMQTMIAKYGDKITGYWAADDAMMLGAIAALKAKNMESKVKFTSDGLYPPTIEYMKNKTDGVDIVGETFHRGYMAAATGLYTSYLAATGKIQVSKMPHKQRLALFKLSCVTPETLNDYLKWDQDIPGWVDSLIKNGPFNTEPAPLVAQGPEKLPAVD